MRELSDEEKAFVEAKLHRHKQGEEVEEIEEDTSPRRRGGLKLVLWLSGFIMLLPVVFSSFFIYGMMRAEALIGREAIEWLGSEEITPDMRESAEASGYGWLPTAAELYAHRGTIVAAAFTIAIVVVLVLFLVAYILGPKEKEEDHGEE